MKIVYIRCLFKNQLLENRNRKSTNYFHFLLLILVLQVFTFYSCLKVEDEKAGVVTESIVFRSGEVLVISGRVLATQEISITNHGFLLDTSEDFPNPTEISLGEKTIPGRFIAEYQMLDIDTDYFAQAFIEDGDGRKLGNTIRFKTLLPTFDSFSPLVGFPNERILIEGKNITADAELYFDDQKAERLSLENESFLEARIPPFDGELFKELTIEMKGQSFAGPVEFEYVSGSWVQDEPFIREENLVANIAFKYENEVVVGHGALDGFGPYTNDIYVYNLDSKVWNSFNFPGPGTGFQFSTSGIIGSGSVVFVRASDRSYSLTNSYYLYKGNGEFVYGGNTPFRLLKAHAERVGNYAYVFGGINSDLSVNKVIWRYDFETDNWEEVREFVKDIETNTDFASFTKGEKIYFVANDGYLYEYDTNINKTQVESKFPGDIIKGTKGIYLDNEKAYVGLSERRRDIYEYSFETKKWKPKSRFIGAASDEVIARWIDDTGDIYFLVNNNAMNGIPHIWKLSPEKF